MDFNHPTSQFVYFNISSYTFIILLYLREHVAHLEAVEGSGRDVVGCFSDLRLADKMLSEHGINKLLTNFGWDHRHLFQL